MTVTATRAAMGTAEATGPTTMHSTIGHPPARKAAFRAGLSG